MTCLQALCRETRRETQKHMETKIYSQSTGIRFRLNAQFFIPFPKPFRPHVAFSNRFHCLRADGSPIRKRKVTYLKRKRVRRQIPRHRLTPDCWVGTTGTDWRINFRYSPNIMMFEPLENLLVLEARSASLPLCCMNSERIG